MTTQEQFESDYLAAFPELGHELDKSADGRYKDRRALVCFFVHQQQRKRHEEEMAELVERADIALEWLSAALECKDWVWDFDQRECAQQSASSLKETIAKFDAPKEKS